MAVSSLYATWETAKPCSLEGKDGHYEYIESAPWGIPKPDLCYVRVAGSPVWHLALKEKVGGDKEADKDQPPLFKPLSQTLKVIISRPEGKPDVFEIWDGTTRICWLSVDDGHGFVPEIGEEMPIAAALRGILGPFRSAHGITGCGVLDSEHGYNTWGLSLCVHPLSRSRHGKIFLRFPEGSLQPVVFVLSEINGPDVFIEKPSVHKGYYRGLTERENIELCNPDTLARIIEHTYLLRQNGFDSPASEIPSYHARPSQITS